MKTLTHRGFAPKPNFGVVGQSLKLIPLGGVGDVTKNMYIYEYGNDIIIVDCGVGFPDDAMPGVDLVIPDISYLRDKKEKIRGILITHGHEDHIGGLPYLWPELQVPIYTQRLTAGFIKNKFTEHGLDKSKIFDLALDAKVKLGVFDVSFYQVSHSVPDSTGIVIRTPIGIIIQQAINVAQKVGRKVALVGRSFENNFQVARDLGYLDIPPGIVIAPDAINSFGSGKVLVLIAGAQGQPESALSRAANEDHKLVKLKDGDSVIFSADPIPSTEAAQSALIDNLSRLGVNVYYSAITSDLHVSGHAALEELRLMVNLAKAKFIFPIGGTFRHMKAFSRMAQDLGYKKEDVLLPEDGDILEIKKESIKLIGTVDVQNVYVDGLGVGDVGHVILRDRQKMNEEGIAVVVVSVDQHTGKLLSDVDIISRGFVFEEMAKEILDEAKEVIRSNLEKH